MALAKMRTVKGTVEFCKKEDPETPVNEYMIRRLVKEGTIPVVYAGCKALINVDKFIDYLNNESVEEVEGTEDSQKYGSIRRVVE